MKSPRIDDVFTFDFSYTDEEIMTYAKISGDVNPIHVSDDYSQNTMYGRCIVHGYYSISIFSKVYGTLLYPENHILISQTAKYIQPIFTGINYTAKFTVKELFPDKNRVLYINEIFEKDSEKIKITGEALLMNSKFYRW